MRLLYVTNCNMDIKDVKLCLSKLKLFCKSLSFGVCLCQCLKLKKSLIYARKLRNNWFINRRKNSRFFKTHFQFFIWADYHEQILEKLERSPQSSIHCYISIRPNLEQLSKYISYFNLENLEEISNMIKGDS